MEEVSELLLQFSTQHNLWEKAKVRGIEAIENYLKEDKAEADRLFPQLTTESFLFVEDSQKLTFWNRSQKTFTTSTKYNLFTDKQMEQSSPVGYYAMDVDSNGTVVDDWLVFY